MNINVNKKFGDYEGKFYGRTIPCECGDFYDENDETGNFYCRTGCDTVTPEEFEEMLREEEERGYRYYYSDCSWCDKYFMIEEMKGHDLEYFEHENFCSNECYQKAVELENEYYENDEEEWC